MTAFVAAHVPRYARLEAAAASSGGQPPQQRSVSSTSQEVAVRFVRLAGLMFDRINLEEYPAIMTSAFTSLEVGMGSSCSTLAF